MEPIDDGAMSPVSTSVRKPLNRPLGDAEMSHPPRIERPYQIDDQWSRAAFLRRTGQVASFLAPHLRAGMRLIDCGCGPGSITIDLARMVAPGEVVGIDRRQASLSDARTFARERGVANVAFELANVYQLPFPDRSFDAAFACALLQHLAAPLAALKEMRRGAGFARTQASGTLTTEAGPPAGSSEETRKAAGNDLIRLRGVLGGLAVARGWAAQAELEQMAEVLIAWGKDADAFYARPSFTAIGWVSEWSEKQLTIAVAIIWQRATACGAKAPWRHGVASRYDLRLPKPVTGATLSPKSAGIGRISVKDAYSWNAPC
jgi:SAM-dependent methyltransferase